MSLAAPLVVIDLVTMTGAGNEITYNIPDGVYSIAFQARNGNIEMRAATGGNFWTLKTLTPEAFDTKKMAGERFFFTGTNTHILEVRYLEGTPEFAGTA